MQFLHRFVVRSLARADRFAEIVEVPDEAAELVVKRAAAPRDLQRIRLLIREPPDVRDSAQRGEQRGIRDQHDVPVERVGEEVRLVRDRGEERGLERDVHEHEIGRVDAVEILVPLGREILHVFADRLDVLFQMERAHRVVRGVDVRLVIRERHLRVDDEVLAFGQLHDHVEKTLLPVLGVGRGFSRSWSSRCSPQLPSTFASPLSARARFAASVPMREI